MDFIKMIMELPGEKRSQDVVEHTEWNSLWKLIVTQGNHSENYLEQLYNYFFNKEEGWVNKVQAELDGVQPYLEGVMTQPVGKAPDGSLWTYPSTESGTVPWGNVMGDITKQQDLIQKFNAKSDVGHGHDISTLTFTEGDIDGSWITDDSIGETAYGSQSIPTRAIKNLSVTSEKLSNGAVTTAKIASSAIINDSIANGSVSGTKIANNTITREKLAQDALYSPLKAIYASPNYAIAPSDISKTLFSDYSLNSSDDIVVTLSQSVSSNIPTGSEIALTYMAGNSFKIMSDGVRFALAGESNFFTTGIKIPDRHGMVAIKKFYVDNTNGDLWLVTGNVEVV